MDFARRAAGGLVAHVLKVIGALLAFAGASAHAADCPVDSTGVTPSTWPTDKTPGATWSVGTVTGIYTVVCGTTINKVNWVISQTGLASMSAAQAYLDANAGTRVRIASCPYLDTGSRTAGEFYVYQNTANLTQYFGYFVITGYSDAACDPVTGDPPFDCSALANVKTLGSANDQPDSFSPEDAICVKNGNVEGASTPMNCAAFRLADQPYKVLGPSGARDHLVRYQFTGLECDAEPQQEPTEPLDTDSDAEKCKTGPGGLTWCESPTPDANDCGYFNDKYTCLKSLGTDKCVTKADGSRICAGTAPTPPVPDNGTPGTKAPPDDTMQVCTGAGACQQVNYYNSTTNTNSTRDTGTGGNADGSGGVGPGGTPAGSGTGDGTEDGVSDDSASGGATCDVAPTCSGDPIQCALLTQQWKTRCPDTLTDAELLSGIEATAAEVGTEAGPNDATVELSGVTGGTIWGGGSCPAPINVSVMGQSMSLDVWQRGCEMALLFAPFVLAMGYFAAALLLIRGGTI